MTYLNRQPTWDTSHEQTLKEQNFLKSIMTNSQWFGIILVGLGIVGLIFIFSNLKMIEKAEEVEEDEVEMVLPED